MSKPIRPAGAIEQPIPQPLLMQQDALQAAARSIQALDIIRDKNIAELQSWNGDIPSDQDRDRLASIHQQLLSIVDALNALKSIASGDALTPAQAVPLCAYARSCSRLEDPNVKQAASPILSFVDRHRQTLGQASVLHGGRGYNNGFR